MFSFLALNMMKRKEHNPMNDQSIARIISYNLCGEKICASAARISTTYGDSIEILENARDNQKNQDLIRKVLASGHKSVIEHAWFTIAFKNVSAYVEQFFIEFRLASFTVKSRRYVDFSHQGYYIPDGLDERERKTYCQYMERMFEGYSYLLSNGVPKEDARFLLPYSFNSNFYCTLNARELLNIIQAIKKGRGKSIPELQSIADQIVSQVLCIYPSLCSELVFEQNDSNEIHYHVYEIRKKIEYFDCDLADRIVDLIQSPRSPQNELYTIHRVLNPLEPDVDYQTLISSTRGRELEHLSYTFLIPSISLSGITHIVRHRMQSIVVPPIQCIDYSRFIMPPSIKGNAALSSYYKNTISYANELLRESMSNENLKKYIYYFALSGNVTSVATTMNARELMLFIRLRSCNRAQWEIRMIAVSMLKLLRNDFPELFNLYGPTCYLTGHCSEGKMSCGKQEQIVSEFSVL